MPNIGLTSFMSILAKGTDRRHREYGKYLTPGGYDFYWKLKVAAADVTFKGRSFASCIDYLQQINRPVERTHNVKGLKSLQKWLLSKEYTFFQPPHGSCSSPKGYLIVKLEPEFRIRREQQTIFAPDLEL